MNCKECRKIINAWFEGDSKAVVSNYAGIKNHMASCGECKKTYGAVMPLIRREAENKPASLYTHFIMEKNLRKNAADTLGTWEAIKYRLPQKQKRPSGYLSRLFGSLSGNGSRQKGYLLSGSGIWKWATAAAAVFVFAVAFTVLYTGGGFGLLKEDIAAGKDGTPESQVISATDKSEGLPVSAANSAEAKGKADLVVRFELAAPEAKSVQLAGDFTDWKSRALPLADKDNDGVWTVTVPLNQNRVYTYNFLINGKRWITDPKAPVTVDDGFGGESSVLNL